jgi:hypothetical protein
MDWPALLKDYGLPVFGLLAFGWAIIKGWLVPGVTHADVKAQRDRALDLVFKMANNIQAIADPDTKGGGKP